MKKSIFAIALAAFSSLAMAASVSVTVDAKNNSTTNETGPLVGVGSLFLTAGQDFTVSASTSDYWTAGPLPRWSNANGLNGSAIVYNSGMDPDIAANVPGIVDNTVIGTGSYVNWMQGGLSAYYGSLVGQINGGNYFYLGASFSGKASDTGLLKLFYFDENNFDNAGSILATVTAVPEPETYAMLLAGLAILGTVVRRRRNLP